MRYFQTEGIVYPEENYIVARPKEVADFIKRVKRGKYIVLFAPRQTGKTTFIRDALERLAVAERTYFPIQLNFEAYKNLAVSDFYEWLSEDIREEIEAVFRQRGSTPSEALRQFLTATTLTAPHSMRRFFSRLATFLGNQRVVLVIDEFDGIPRETVSDFLHTLRRIYLSDRHRCPYSVGIVGVKNISQLNYDWSISPFNIQNEFNLPNFTREQVQELLGQYTIEVGQAFAPAVIESLHRQTGGQPVLVNCLAQILTEEMGIPRTEPIGMAHFASAYSRLLDADNVNMTHLTTNVRRNPRFQRVLMQITSSDRGVDFNLRDDVISELASYGVIKRGADRMCEISNPMYLHSILQTFKPTINGLEEEYYPQDTGNDVQDYLTSAGQIDMEKLLNNFRDFIARAGFRILQVPQTPKEHVGQHLLLAYLDRFVRLVHGVMHLEVQPGRGRIVLVVNHRGRKHIVETKIWQGQKSYQAGKAQLAAYLKLEGVAEGDYVVFDYRKHPEPRVETETLAGDLTIRSYVIPVVQEMPSDARG